jgi:hypothetical protein
VPLQDTKVSANTAKRTSEMKIFLNDISFSVLTYNKNSEKVYIIKPLSIIFSLFYLIVHHISGTNTFVTG